MVRTGISVFCRCQSIAHSLTLAHTLTHALTQIQWIHCELVLCVRASVRLLLLLSQCIGIWPWRINMCVLARLVRNSFVVRALTLLQFGVSFTLGSEPISVSVFILLLIWFAHWFFFCLLCSSFRSFVRFGFGYKARESVSHARTHRLLIHKNHLAFWFFHRTARMMIAYFRLDTFIWFWFYSVSLVRSCDGTPCLSVAMYCLQYMRSYEHTTLCWCVFA